MTTIKYNENKDFVKILIDMMEKIDEINEKYEITSQEYNEIQISFKNLYEIKQTIKDNKTYKQLFKTYNSQERSPVLTEKQKLEKLKNQDPTTHRKHRLINCPNCNNIMKEEYLEKHKQTTKCKRILQSKHGVKNSKKIFHRYLFYETQQVINLVLLNRKHKYLDENAIDELQSSFYKWRRIDYCKYEKDDS